MSGTVLGRAVLEISTDQSKARQGLTELRAETLRQTARISNEAKIKYQAELTALKTANQQVLIDARATKRLVEQQTRFQYSLDLAKYQSDLRTAEREHAASVRRMQQQAKESGGAGLGGALLSGLGIGSGAAVVQAGIRGIGQALGAGKSAFIDYNSAIDDTRATLLGLTHDSAATEKILADLRTEADKTPFTFRELADSVAGLLPLARQSGTALQDLIKLAETLAALNPNAANGGGFGGAVIALQNASTGDLTSLRDRFNISTAAIQRYREQGLSHVAAIQAGLKALGIDETLVGNLSLTLSGRLSTLSDTLSGLAGRSGEPLFAGTKQAVADLTIFLNSPEVQGAAREFDKNLRAALADPELQAGAKVIAIELRDIAAASADAAKGLAELGGGALSGVLRGAKVGADALHGFGDALDKLDKQLTGTSDHADLFLEHFSGRRPPVTLFDIIDALKEIGRLMDDPKIAAALSRQPQGGPTSGQNTGPGSFPNAGPNPSGGQGPQIAPPPFIGPTAPPARPGVPFTGNLDPEFDPGRGSAIFPEGERQRAMFERGRRDLQAYLDGFNAQDFDLFSKLGPQIQDSFKRAFAGLSPDALQAGLANLDPLIAQITKDIDTIGHTSAATQAAIRGVFGQGADEIIRLADAYGRAAQAAGALMAATAALGAAQGNFNVVTAAATNAIDKATRAVSAAQSVAARHQQQTQNALQSLQDDLAAIDREAQNVSRAYDDQLRGLQGLLTASQRASEEAQRQFASQIEAAQKEQEAIQAAGQQHSDAYAAILAGNTDEFLRNKQLENEALDEQTRKILEAGQAYLQFARDATAADHAVRAADEREHQIRLDFERRIQAARNANRPGEVARLSAERDRVLARERANSQVTRAEAVVAGDKAQDARDPIERAAREQAEKDKIAAAAAGKRVEEIQEQAKQRAEADRLAQQALSDQIAAVQEEARQSAQMYADRKQGVQDEITEVERRARIQKEADDAAILAAQNTLEKVKLTEQARIDAAKKGLENAQGAANQAKAEYDWQIKTLDTMKLKNSALDDYIKKWQEFIKDLKAQGIDVSQFFGAPATTPKPQSPVPGNVPETPPGTPPPPPRSPAPVPPTAPTAPVCPPGSHPEYDAANDSWSCVKDGGFFGGVGTSLQRAYTAPIAPTATYRAPVPPALNAASYTAGLAAASLAARPAPGGAAAVTYQFNKEIVRIDTLNAGDQQEMDRALRAIREETLDAVFGTGLEAFEVAKRGSVVSGLRR